VLRVGESIDGLLRELIGVDSGALTVDLGERTSGGYSIRVDSIYESEGALSINATEIKPGSTCFVTTAMMTPYVFLKVFSVGRVEAISWKSEVIDCNQK